MKREGSTEAPPRVPEGNVAGHAAARPASRVVWRPYWGDVVGVLWIVAAAGLALVPVIVHGPYFGTFDTLRTSGILNQPGLVPHNVGLPDQADEVVPWLTAAWIQVHHGYLPLWAHNEALGLPLAFNFGSGAFGFSTLLSYLAPLRAAYWVQTVVNLIVGGTGAYFFGRVLRCHPVACALAGTTWVLSGPFFGYLGLPDTSVMAWAGWQFAAALLIVRGTRRYWSVVLFAVAFAFSILAGNPQIELVILLALGVFLAVLLFCRTGRLGERGPIRRPLVDLVAAFVAGAALCAPLTLPGLQLANSSIRNAAQYASANPVSQVYGLVFQSFWGQPLPGSFKNAQGLLPGQWVWVGAIAFGLAVVAAVRLWRRPAILGLASAAIVTLGASVVGPVDSLLNTLPYIGHSWWSRSLIPLAFCVAMLAGVGLDAVLRSSQRTARTALVVFAAVAAILWLLWLVGRGTLPAQAAHVRADSFLWPVACTVVGLVAFGTLVWVGRSKQWWSEGRSRRLVIAVVAALLVCQTASLIVIDAPLQSSSPTPYPVTTSVASLQRIVGSSLVGLGAGGQDHLGLGLGLPPDANLVYGIDEFAEYDPIAPNSWFATWSANGTAPGLRSFYDFIPRIKDATVARRYGISYVLESRTSAPLPGGVFDTYIGNEKLYRVPDSSIATLVSTPASGFPAVDAPGTGVSVKWVSPSKLRVVTDSSSEQVLRLRVASVPGWNATIDGNPLQLQPFQTMMFQVRVPPGHHVIELNYWPRKFTEGIVLAAVAVIVLVAVGVVGRWRRRQPAADGALDHAVVADAGHAATRVEESVNS